MAITRLDVLDALPSLKICTAYKLDDKTIDNFPASVADLERCQPVYEELDGWQTPTSHIKEYDQLPLQARRYIERLEELIPCPVSLVCVGPEREQTVEVRPVW
jgi:adenylosuccinate synthase